MPYTAENRRPSRWRWIVDVSYGAAATASLGLAFYSVILDRAASAGIAAAFCISFIFLRHLPVIESFKAFNLEAKFARRVDEFDRLLDYVRSTAEVSSRMLYSQLAWIDRMGSMGWGKKREFMREMDEHLSKLDVSPDFIASAKRPILNIATYDLFGILQQSAYFFLKKRQAEITEKMNAIQEQGPLSPDNPTWNNLNKQRISLQLPKTQVGDLSGETPLSDLKTFSDRFLAQWNWSDKEQSVLNIIRTEVVGLASECWKYGTVTEAAEEYLGEYEYPDDKRVKEILKQSAQ